MRIKLLSLMFFVFVAVQNWAQQTVGVFSHTEDNFLGYALFAPTTSKATYLIDNCGKLIQRWESDYLPGLATYLLEDGSLLRCGRANSDVFNGGGKGGIIERFDWDGNQTWSFVYNNDDYMQHHDVAYMPNGNILLIAWEYISGEEAIQAGKNPLLLGSAVFSEHVVEIEPLGVDSAHIVWEWHLWDHLVQDYDAEKDNFGVVADHPELMDLNYPNIVNQDWIHFNAIDYNEELDQIALSSRHLNEIWIIDHSTTTEEAAGHAGGNSGKGGDILYRWGNPEAYGHGGGADIQFFGQHDVTWIPQGYEGEGQLMVFNNGIGRPEGFYSSVDVIAPPVDEDGHYFYEDGQAYGPDTFSWQYIAEEPLSLFSSNISGARRLPNGNTIICEGRDGTFWEVDLAGNVVWHYINPVVQSGPVVQGTDIFSPLGGSNAVFRVMKYGVDFPGFEGRDMTPGDPVELEPWPNDCVVSDVENRVEQSIGIYPNPAQNILWVALPDDMGEADVQFALFDIEGRKILEKVWHGVGQRRIHLPTLASGMYIVKVVCGNRVFSEKLMLN